MSAKLNLLTNIIDCQCLFEIIAEEYENYYQAENDECVKRLVTRIEEAKQLKSKYLTLLN